LRSRLRCWCDVVLLLDGADAKIEFFRVISASRVASYFVGVFSDRTDTTVLTV